MGERLAEGEAHLVPVDGCWRPATWGRCRVSIQKWDQRFESAFLQRGVWCEPDFDISCKCKRSSSLTSRDVA